MSITVPPGRAGRQFLRHRLETARRAATLLDHKRRELEVEKRRLSAMYSDTRRSWEAALNDAEESLNRARATSGISMLRLGAAVQAAECRVDLLWRSVMGVRYPTRVETRLTDARPVALLPGGAALAVTRDAHRRALTEAIGHAAVEAAVRRIDAELARTRRRLRSLEIRAIPDLEAAIRDLDLRLDESDREDLVRTKWATEVGAVPRRSEEGT